MPLSRDTSASVLGLGFTPGKAHTVDLADLEEIDAFRREQLKERLALGDRRGGLQPSASTASIATNADNDAVFKASWNDERAQKEQRLFYFFMSAETGHAQVDEIAPDGETPLRTIVLPQVLPKPAADKHGRRPGAYGIDDLRCGALISVLGRQLRLVSCGGVCDAHGLAQQVEDAHPPELPRLRMGLAGVDLRQRGLLSDAQVCRVIRNLRCAPSLSDAQLEVFVGQYETSPGSRIIDYNKLCDRFGCDECPFGRFSADTCAHLKRGRRRHDAEETSHALAAYLKLIGRGTD